MPGANQASSSSAVAAPTSTAAVERGAGVPRGALRPLVADEATGARLAAPGCARSRPAARSTPRRAANRRVPPLRRRLDADDGAVVVDDEALERGAGQHGRVPGLGQRQQGPRRSAPARRRASPPARRRSAPTRSAGGAAARARRARARAIFGGKTVRPAANAPGFVGVVVGHAAPAEVLEAGVALELLDQPWSGRRGRPRGARRVRRRRSSRRGTGGRRRVRRRARPARSPGCPAARCPAPECAVVPPTCSADSITSVRRPRDAAAYAPNSPVRIRRR